MNSKLLISHSLIKLAVFTAFLSATHAQAAGRIVGGVNLSAKDPHAAATVAILTRGPQGVGICTGTLIASDLIVTAAHCVSDYLGRPVMADNVIVIFNTDVKAGISEHRKVIKALPHPAYKGIYSKGADQNDIALVRFPGGLPQGFRAAALLPSSVPLKKKMLTTLVGFGVNQQDPKAGGTGAGQLRRVNVRVEKPIHGKTEVILDQTQGGGACHGDSGGPAIVTIQGRSYVWGVTSRGYPENAPDDCAHYSVYTRISTHMKFMKEGTTLLRQLN